VRGESAGRALACRRGNGSRGGRDWGWCDELNGALLLSRFSVYKRF
jgi:hypothetical protein